MKPLLAMLGLMATCLLAQAAPTPSYHVPLGLFYGVASQSSTGYGGVAERANDGDTEGSYWANSVTSTADGDLQPWWQVALSQDFDIAVVQIHNRSDCCIERLSDFTVSLLNDGVVVASQAVASLSGPVISLDFGAARGDTVRIAKNTEYLSLAEVHVFEAIPRESPGGEVPEPHALALAALGLGALRLSRRRI